MTDKSIPLLPEDIQRLIGKDAQRNNILAARMVADIIKTTLGPKGMDKMLVSPTNDIIVTNDGVTILDEMQIEHPAAKMMVEIAKTQESEVGDGTTTAVMLAGKLLENAEKLLDKKIHPTVITSGYRMAASKAQEILEELALRITFEDDEVLKQIAMVAMTGKGAEVAKERFAEIIVKAVKQVQENGNIDLDDIKIKKVQENGIENTKLISGIILEKERISQDMPKKIEEAKIALIDFPLELKNPEIDTKISVSSPNQLHDFLMQEEQEIKSMVEKIKRSGANVLFCQKGIDDFAKYLLSKERILACRRVASSDMQKLAKTTGGKIVSNLNELNPSELGDSKLVEEVSHGEEKMIHVLGCKNPKAVTILINGGSLHVLEEIERALKDGLGDVVCALKSGLVVVGGGAVEIELSKKLKEFGNTLYGREKLAVEEFASALEFIPSTLAENAGLDPIDILTELKAKHNAGERNAGLNLFTNKIDNMLEANIIEPLKIKTQAISSASEVATMILRIDDVIASKPNNKGSMRDTGSMDFNGLS